MRSFKRWIPVALVCSLFGLSACGSVDHDPPKLESVFGSVSPMDTLVAVFDKSIDDFDEDQVSSNVKISVVKQKGKKIFIVGAEDTVAGIPRLLPASDYDTLRFENLKDDDGNKSKLQTVTFSTYPFLDGDEYEGSDCYSNSKPKDAEVLMDSSLRFYDGSKLTKGITVTGILGGQYSKNCADGEDLFKIYLKKRDTVSVRLSGRTASIPLELAVLGPAKMKDAPAECQFDNDEFLTVDLANLKKKTAIDTTFGIGDIHECGTNTVTDYLAYYIVVRYSESISTKDQLPQPYTLSVSIGQK